MLSLILCPFCREIPQTASVVYDLDNYMWNDEPWLEKDRRSVLDKPVNIYEVHLGSWKQEPDDDPKSETGFKPYSL